MAMRICPSILNADRSKIFDEIERVATADLLHLDVMDNLFVPNQTFTFQECEEIIRKSPIPVDSHLMIIDPDERAEMYARVGSANVTFHYEASANPLSTIKKIKAHGARAGLAIKPQTKFEEVEEYLPEIDMLLIMTVEPGFGGQAFMTDQLVKIHAARDAIKKLSGIAPWLEVDGGISIETIRYAAEAGADTFVAGSAIYKSDDAALVIRTLRELVNV
ncbi:MAG: ribulose-phosphate 3-epimerase [Actinomycetota bacterium]